MNKTVNSSSIDSRSTLPGPTSAGSSGVAAPKPAASTITKSIAASLPIPVKRNPRSLKKGNQKLRSDRVPKEANDPIAPHNKFEALEQIDCAQFPSSTRVRSHSPKKQKGRISPVKHTKQT